MTTTMNKRDFDEDVAYLVNQGKDDGITDEELEGCVDECYDKAERRGVVLV